MLLVLTGCANDDAPKKKAGAVKKTGAKEAKKSNIKLDLFTTPAFIDGCAELFTYDTCKSKNKFIFATDYGDNTIIKIKGKEIRLTRDNGKGGGGETRGKDFINVFRGNGYKVTLKLKLVKQYDEGAEYKGTLQVTGNKTEATFRIRGTGGC